MGGAREDRGSCPSCDRTVEAGAWICPYCDFILDPSVLGTGDEDRAPGSKPVWSESTGDAPEAMILGDVNVDPEDFQVLPGAGAAGDGRTATFLFYTSGATSRVLRPDVIPVREPSVAERAMPTTPYEDFILAAIDGKRSVRDIQRTSGLAPQEVTITLLTLIDKQVVRIQAPPPPAADTVAMDEIPVAKPRSPRKPSKRRKSEASARRAAAAPAPAPRAPEGRRGPTRVLDEDPPPARARAGDRRAEAAHATRLTEAPRADAPRAPIDSARARTDPAHADDHAEATVGADPPPSRPAVAEPARPPRPSVPQAPSLQAPSRAAAPPAEDELPAVLPSALGDDDVDAVTEWSALPLSSGALVGLALGAIPPAATTLPSDVRAAEAPRAVAEQVRDAATELAPLDRAETEEPSSGPEPSARALAIPKIHSAIVASARATEQARARRDAVDDDDDLPEVDPDATYDATGEIMAADALPRPAEPWDIAPTLEHGPPPPDPDVLALPRVVEAPSAITDESPPGRAEVSERLARGAPPSPRAGAPREGPTAARASTPLPAPRETAPVLPAREAPPSRDSAPIAREVAPVGRAGVALSRASTPPLPRESTPAPPSRSSGPPPQAASAPVAAPPVSRTPGVAIPAARAAAEDAPLEEELARYALSTPLPELGVPSDDPTPPPRLEAPRPLDPPRLPAEALRLEPSRAADPGRSAEPPARAEPLRLDLLKATPAAESPPPVVPVSPLMPEDEDDRTPPPRAVPSTLPRLDPAFLVEHQRTPAPAPAPIRSEPPRTRPSMERLMEAKPGPRAGVEAPLPPRVGDEPLESSLGEPPPRRGAVPPPRRSEGPKPEPKPIEAKLEPKVEPRAEPAPKVDPTKARRTGPAPDGVQMAKAAKLFEEATKERAEGNLVSARMNMKLAMTFDPSNVLYQQAYDELLKMAPPGTPSASSRARDLYDKASAAERLSRFDEAIELLEKALEEHKDAAVYNRLGVLLAMKKNEFVRAQELIETALVLSPGNSTYQHNLSKVLQRAAAHDVKNQSAPPKKKDGLLGSLLGRRK